MSSRLPLSVTIITQDEADRISPAIQSVQGWVDEVIIIDSGSTDNTRQIAEQLGARVIHHDWPGYGLQKRFAEDQARNDWILNIDADERVTPELKAELCQLFESDQTTSDGYFIAIHDRLLCTDRLSRYTPYKPVRLYRKSQGRYSTSPVHDRVEMSPEASTASLKGRLAHDSLRSFHHRVEKMNAYTEAQVSDLISKGRKPSVLRILTEFWSAFIISYFMRGRWKEGLIGYIYAINFAYSRFLRQIKLYEAFREKGRRP